MESDNFLLILAIVAVAVSIIGAGVTYNSLAVFKNRLTGMAVGDINLTVESLASINFTTNNINWGSGRVNNGQDNATLDTSIQGDANVTRGNWTGNTDGLVIENIGNVNVTLNISAGKNSSDLLGGTNATYEYNISANSEPGSCLNTTDGALNYSTIDVFLAANTTTRMVCPLFPFDNNNDKIRLDIRLTIPSDSVTGAVSDLITATAVTV